MCVCVCVCSCLKEKCVKTLAYCDSTYWSLVADIYIYMCVCGCLKENCVKTLAYCDSTYWSLVDDIYIYIFISLFNPLNAELNPICYLLALLGAHHFLLVCRIRVKRGEMH